MPDLRRYVNPDANGVGAIVPGHLATVFAKTCIACVLKPGELLGTVCREGIARPSNQSAKNVIRLFLTILVSSDQK